MSIAYSDRERLSSPRRVWYTGDAQQKHENSAEQIRKPITEIGAQIDLASSCLGGNREAKSIYLIACLLVLLVCLFVHSFVCLLVCSFVVCPCVRPSVGFNVRSLVCLLVRRGLWPPGVERHVLSFKHSKPPKTSKPIS